MNFKRTIDVVTTTADYVETAKDIKDGKGITGFDVILDIVRMVFKAIAKVVKWLFRAIGWFWDPKNIDLSGVHETTKRMQKQREKTSREIDLGYYD